MLYRTAFRVILDVVFDTAEMMSMTNCRLRGLDERYYYRRYWDRAQEKERLSNGAGCGSYAGCDASGRAAAVLDSLRYWAAWFGVAGFRFDWRRFWGAPQTVSSANRSAQRRLKTIPCSRRCG